MPAVRSRYQAVGPVLIRASTDPGDLDSVPPPDLTAAATALRDGLAWLGRQWSRPEVREAFTVASPDLAARVRQILAPDAEPTAVAVRRAVLTTASYLLRWQRRATPFGPFAGVTTATVGPAVAKIGDGHRAIARADADWLALVADCRTSPTPRSRECCTASSAGTS
jgi:lantibiotic biosynthesis protein